MLGSDGVLLLPTFPTSATTHYGTYLRSADCTYLAIANAFALPCTQVPIGYGKDGLPYGIQILGGPNSDGLCLAIAKEIELYLKDYAVSNLEKEINVNVD